MFRLIVLLILALAYVPTLAAAKDKTIEFRGGNAEMAAAITKARGTLAEFWAMMNSPAAGVDRFALKVAISEPGNKHTEHFWLSNIERTDGDKVVGTIDNDPNYIKSVKLGQRFTFGRDKISDWMFMRNGKIVGAWTLRVMIRRMKGPQAAHCRRMLETP